MHSCNNYYLFYRKMRLPIQRLGRPLPIQKIAWWRSVVILIHTVVILYILQENETANPETANPEAGEAAANPKASMVEVSCYYMIAIHTNIS